LACRLSTTRCTLYILYILRPAVHIPFTIQGDIAEDQETGFPMEALKGIMQGMLIMNVDWYGGWGIDAEHHVLISAVFVENRTDASTANR